MPKNVTTITTVDTIVKFVKLLFRESTDRFESYYQECPVEVPHRHQGLFRVIFFIIRFVYRNNKNAVHSVIFFTIKGNIIYYAFGYALV